MTQRMGATYATIVVLAHALVGWLHGRAHSALDVPLTPAQDAFVYVVIVAAPLIAAALLWTPWRSWGTILLFASMAGSLIFGVYFHFVAIGPDHVSMLQEGTARSMFQVTAVLLSLTETLGAVIGVALLSTRGKGSS